MFMAKAKKKKKITKKKARKANKIDIKPKPPRNNKGQLTSGWGRGSKQVKKKTLKVKKKKALRAANGQLLPGTPSISTGRPKDRSFMDDFRQAIREVEKEKRLSLLKRFVRKAYDDNRVMISCIDRLLPALKAIQIQEVPGDGMSEEEKEEIRKEHKRRFEGLYNAHN